LGTDDEARERLATVKTYIPEYLHALIGAGHNILHTIPLVKDAAYSLGSLDTFALTNVSFKVLAPREVTIKTCQLQEPQNALAPLLMIYGVCSNRPLPPFLGTWSSGWLAVTKGSVGTMGISRQLFLQRHIIDALTVVNEHTTIVPRAVDVIDGQWYVELVAWAGHANRKKSRSGCGFIQKDSGSLEHLKYEWSHIDNWSHEHQDSGAEEANGEYTLSCKFFFYCVYWISLTVRHR
jgi:hypothetical protein